MPTKEPERSSLACLAFGGGQEARVAGVTGRLGQALDGGVGERLGVQVARPDILGMEEVPGLADEPELGRRGGLGGDLAAGQGADPLEAGSRREDRDDEEAGSDDDGALAKPASDGSCVRRPELAAARGPARPGRFHRRVGP